jgi:hypothetical protein
MNTNEVERLLAKDLNELRGQLRATQDHLLILRTKADDAWLRLYVDDLERVAYRLREMYRSWDQWERTHQERTHREH